MGGSLSLRLLSAERERYESFEPKYGARLSRRLLPQPSLKLA
jgi:hypothetical protein